MRGSRVAEASTQYVFSYSILLITVLTLIAGFFQHFSKDWVQDHTMYIQLCLNYSPWACGSCRFTQSMSHTLLGVKCFHLTGTSSQNPAPNAKQNRQKSVLLMPSCFWQRLTTPQLEHLSKRASYGSSRHMGHSSPTHTHTPSYLAHKVPFLQCHSVTVTPYTVEGESSPYGLQWL